MVCWGNNQYGQATVPGGLGERRPGVHRGVSLVCGQGRRHAGLLGREQHRAGHGPRRHRRRHRDHRRLRAHVRDQDRRHPDLLGQQLPRAAHDPGRNSAASLAPGIGAAGRCQRTPTTPVRSRPTAPRSAGAATPAASSRFRAASAPSPRIAAGNQHSCAIKTDGTPACWGNNAAGRPRSRAAPAPSPQITAGAAHTCAIKTDGTPACWGYNAPGQTTIPGGIGTVTQITAGEPAHVCDQDRRHPDLLGLQRLRASPSIPAGTGTVTQIAAGHRHTCAIKTDGTPSCWGYRPSFGESTIPAAHRHRHPARRRRLHTCAIKTDGTPTCWGDDSDGQRDAAPVITSARPLRTVTGTAARHRRRRRPRPDLRGSRRDRRCVAVPHQERRRFETHPPAHPLNAAVDVRQALRQRRLAHQERLELALERLVADLAHLEREPEARRRPLGRRAGRRASGAGRARRPAGSGRSRRRAARDGGRGRARAAPCARTCGRGSRSAGRCRAPASSAACASAPPSTS